MGTNATSNGVLTFNKAAGTYTVDLDNPIQGFSISQLQPEHPSLDMHGAHRLWTVRNPDVSVSQIAPNLFVQFTGIDGASSTVNYPLVSPPTGNGTASSFVNGELFDTVNDSWVSVSNAAAGVAGDTIGGDEILNFNLYTSNPTGIVGVPTGRAQSMFLKFDGIGASEDFIVIVKLFNSTTGAYTTKALMVQNGDIQERPRCWARHILWCDARQ